MKLQRTNKKHWAVINVYKASDNVCVDFSTDEDDNTLICSMLDEREVEDLITMLQYYKLQVWPEDKEN